MATVLVHHFDEATGVYLFSSPADKDPLNPENVLVPHAATLSALPVEEPGFVRRFANGAWGHVPAGEIEAEPTPDPVVTPAMVDEHRDSLLVAGFVFSGTAYDFNDRAKANIAGAAQLAFMAVVAGAQPGDLRWHGEDEDFEWIAQDNSNVAMDAFTVIEFGKTAAAHERKHIFAARDLKNMDPIPLDFTDSQYWP